MFEKRIEKIVGIKQCIKFLKNSSSKDEFKFFVAKDADDKLVNPIVQLAQDKNVEINYIATMKDLGQLCAIDVGAAVAIFNS